MYRYLKQPKVDKFLCINITKIIYTHVYNVFNIVVIFWFDDNERNNKNIQSKNWYIKSFHRITKVNDYFTGEDQQKDYDRYPIYVYENHSKTEILKKQKSLDL